MVLIKHGDDNMHNLAKLLYMMDAAELYGDILELSNDNMLIYILKPFDDVDVIRGSLRMKAMGGYYLDSTNKTVAVMYKFENRELKIKIGEVMLKYADLREYSYLEQVAIDNGIDLVRLGIIDKNKPINF